MDGETDERRKYNELVTAICVLRDEIDSLPPWAGEIEPYRQNREELYRRYADLERQLIALRARVQRPASALAAADAEILADEPILATASRSAQ